MPFFVLCSLSHLYIFLLHQQYFHLQHAFFEEIYAKISTCQLIQWLTASALRRLQDGESDKVASTSLDQTQPRPRALTLKMAAVRFDRGDCLRQKAMKENI